MKIPAHTLDALVLRQLTDAERAMSAVYVDEQLRPAGQASIGGREYAQDTPYLVAFVDQQPGANWMHPSRYLLIDPATAKVTSINSDRPPLFGTLPPTWRLVWRSQGIDDWRLLLLSQESSRETQERKEL